MAVAAMPRLLCFLVAVLVPTRRCDIIHGHSDSFEDDGRNTELSPSDSSSTTTTAAQNDVLCDRISVVAPNFRSVQGCYELRRSSSSSSSAPLPRDAILFARDEGRAEDGTTLGIISVHVRDNPFFWGFSLIFTNKNSVL